MFCICFRFCLLCRVESVEHCLWEKQHHEAIQSSRNFETALTAEPQNEYFGVFGCESEDIHILINENQIPCSFHGVWGSHWWWWRHTSIHLPILHGLRLNTEAYIKCLTKVVLPWIKRIAVGSPYVCQQDSLPCHKCKRTQCLLSEHFCDHITPSVWPPNSIYYNSLDYHVWVWLSERPTKPRARWKMKWRQR